MEEQNKKTNYFVRVLIVFFCLGLSFMIGYNFFFIEPVGDVRSGIYILLSILLILVLSESFDNFSIGKLISIKRAYDNKKNENEKLEQKNTQLINHIVSITNSQTQKQTNVFGDLYSENRKNIQPKKNANENVQELIDRIGNSIVITSLETRIKDELKEKDLEIDSDTSTVLVRHLAGTQLMLEFERIHSVIFGSQIYLLKDLNSSIPDGLLKEEVYAHIERVRQHFSESLANWSNEQYLSFLYSSILIVDGDGNTIHITNMGVEYLIWITRNGFRDNKPL